MRTNFLVAIVGKPNVGKSTLFNRLLGRNVAVVDDEPGVTRDRIYGQVTWQGLAFSVADTGGIGLDESKELETAIRSQALTAINDADLILFLVDARSGLTSLDYEVADLLRRSDKHVLLVANKAESPKAAQDIPEFTALGFGMPRLISAIHGIGVGELLDEIVSFISEAYILPAKQDSSITVAVIGRPNVGKSSLVNTIAGAERVIVSESPGTTRDSVDVHWSRDGNNLTFVDTAGIRRKTRIDNSIERYSVLRSFRAIDRCDVAALLIDGVLGGTDQDKRIANYVVQTGKGICLVISKWDLVRKTGKSKRIEEQYTQMLRDYFYFIPYAPIIPTSAYTGYNIEKLINTILEIANRRNAKLPQAELNHVIEMAQQSSPRPRSGRRQLRIKKVRQEPNPPPTFLLEVNHLDLFSDPYKRYLEGQLRKAFDLEGTPIKLIPVKAGT